MMDITPEEYKKLKDELIQINHKQRKKVSLSILLVPNQIHQTWKTKDSSTFQFLLLSKHLTKKTLEIIKRDSNPPIKVGFNISNQATKYYSIQEIELTDNGKMCLVTLNCPTESDKKLLEERFKKLV